MPNYIDLTGQRFGRLTVLERVPNYKSGKNYDCAVFRCKCDCGNETLVASHNLRTGSTTSCGCYRLEQLRKAKAKQKMGVQ